MSFRSPTDADTPFLPIEFQLPSDREQWRDEIAERHRLISDQVNIRENGQYENSTGAEPHRILTGQRWFTSGDNQTKRYTFRSVVDFGALPNAGTTNVAHGITTTANTLFTRIYGVSTDPGGAAITRAIPLPFVDPGALANGILLEVGAVNVTITTAIDYSAFTTTYVILEYILD